MARIELREISKTFHPSRTLGACNRVTRGASTRIEALKPLTLSIEPGSCLGIMGSNGAGKTTLLKLIAGLVLPSTGTVCIDGRPSLSLVEAGRLMGFVPAEQPGLYDRLTGRQNLQFFAALYGLKGAAARHRIAALLDLLQLEGPDIRFQEYSTGLRQRFVLARSLLHNPSILLLDEPTRGLDPLHAERFRDLLRNNLFTQQPLTVIFTSHNIEETESLARQLLILHHGEARVSGNCTQLCAQKSLKAIYAEACRT